jgi:hypothetical protein
MVCSPHQLINIVMQRGFTMGLKVSIVLIDKFLQFLLMMSLTNFMSCLLQPQRSQWNFNNKFALTSFDVKYDKNLCKRNKGIYTFRVQGQVYDYINDLLPLDGHPSYLKLYFYDTEHEIENQIYDSDRLNPSILRKIIDTLKINPYCAFFWTSRMCLI